VHEDIFDKLRIYRSHNIGIIGYKYLQNKYNSDANIIIAMEKGDLYWRGKRCSLIEKEVIEQEIKKTYNYGGKFFINNDYIYLPPILTYKGNIDLMNKLKIGFVGSRTATSIGMKYCQYLINEVKDNRVIVSGLAIGIDATAHACCINNTIAVIAGGINIVYPQENMSLQYLIEEQGLVLTEKPYNMQIKSSFFIERNRIIAALSDPLCVIEASASSGALSTAKIAKSYEHMVFAALGHPLDISYEGCYKIILDNTASILTQETLLNYIYNPIKHFKDVYYLDMTVSQMDKDKLLSLLSLTPVSINDLSKQMPMPTLLAALGELEYEHKIAFNSFFHVSKIIN